MERQTPRRQSKDSMLREMLRYPDRRSIGAVAWVSSWFPVGKGASAALLHESSGLKNMFELLPSAQFSRPQGEDSPYLVAKSMG